MTHILSKTLAFQNSLNKNQLNLSSTERTVNSLGRVETLLKANKRDSYQPHPLPFSTDRLNWSMRQAINGRSQLLDANGAFVLTNVGDLPEGGRKVTHLLEKNQIKLHIVGDMGIKNRLQMQVVAKLTADVSTQSENAHSIVMGLGDWIYPSGPSERTHSEIERSKDTVFNQYQPLTTMTDLYGVLGNHEYGDASKPADPGVFIELANESGIQIPGRYYSLVFKNKDMVVNFIAMDTSTMAVDVAQQEWVKEQIRNSKVEELESDTTHWRILVGHHPIQTSGTHHDENLFLGDLLYETFPNVDLYLAGHEHGIEFLKSNNEHPFTVISGSGAESHPIYPSMATEYCTDKPGFVTITIDESRISIDSVLLDNIG